MQKLKNLVKRFIKKDGFLYKGISKIYHSLSTMKYKITNRREIKEKNKYYDSQVNRAVEILNGYHQSEYVVFYNPTWLGVAASTKGLFKNNVPLEQVFGIKNVQKVAKAVVDNQIKTAIFSQIVDGWTQVIEEIKKLNPEVKIKVIWHGNCYEFFSDYTWNLNKEVMNLYKEKKIEAFAFVRSTMYEFYKKVGFKSFYLQNNVHKKDIPMIKKEKTDQIKIGIYNADTRELKNIYTALSAMKLVPNAVADVVPINEGAKKFTEILGLETTSINDYIPNEELLKRIQNNDINIYPTFTENAPMFPLESFEMGVPCLLGNNNDYFVGTKLGDYVILTREDDPAYIKERILNCMEHKEEIMKLYEEWKKQFDVKCDKLVELFVK
ncbi:MAG TPA: glycosyltransferase [Candidatus Merdicola faecigallinarum]|uniref:Glycosyltransferase n=1 Tax=Candidatus Merdicola faecigallinarum TaxID=2840862 RepID=A0A9D1S9L4_9FIRM|nr:glycosyltransferase [Candidatus Merdicola faecigallinarum]